MECGGKRSATPLLNGRSACDSQEKRRRAPPHSTGASADRHFYSHPTGLRTWTGSTRLTCVIGDIRQFLHAALFEPFVIVTSNGNRYRVPSADHATINPQGSR